MIVGRTSKSATVIICYYTCKVGGCRKRYRVVRNLVPIDPEVDFDIDERYIEEVRDDIHDHAAAGINMRGMSASQKEVVIRCEKRRMSQPKRVIDEFTRLATAAIASNAFVIPTPTPDMISSFLSNRKKASRNGVAVGRKTLQDLARFSNSNRFGKSIFFRFKTSAVT